jgi:ABC-type multidrug transport system fused ATPase/permease subunit
MIVAVLAKVGMWSVIEPRGGLDADFEDLGFSAGQLQLFCLARALLLRNSVVLLDEATSNVDRQTDEQIRRVIREELGGRTILEVAHRLDAIKDYDVVVVMGEGRILEMGSPKDLLGRPNSAFRALSNSRSL